MTHAAPPSASPRRHGRPCVATLRAGAAAVAAVLLLAGPAQAAQPAVGLGTAGPFAVLAGSTITNTGPSTVGGDLGLSPGPSVSGFGGAGNGTVSGATHIADAVALQAKSDLDTAFADAAGRTPAASLPADLAGAGVLTAGVYRAPSALQLTGSVTLDAQGDPAAVFILQVGSALTTASGSRVELVNGAQPCNVFWQVGSSATLGTGSDFSGTVMADQSITLLDSVTVHGRVLARVAAVSLIDDTILRPACAAPTAAGVTPAPDPASGSGSGPTTASATTTAPATAPAPAPATASAPAPASVTPGPGATSTPAAAPAPGEAPGVSSPPAAGSAAAQLPAPAPAALLPASGAGAPPSPAGAAVSTSPAPATGRAPVLTVVNGGTGRTQVTVTGTSISAVTVAVDDRRVAALPAPPRRVAIVTRDGVHRLTVRVTFSDGRPPMTMRRRFRTRRPGARHAHPARRTLARPPLTGGGFAG